jgi:hypothetical protein
VRGTNSYFLLHLQWPFCRSDCFFTSHSVSSPEEQKRFTVTPGTSSIFLITLKKEIKRAKYFETRNLHSIALPTTSSDGFIDSTDSSW